MLVKLSNESQVISLIFEYIAKNNRHSRLRSPDYINTQFFSSQWKISGRELRYQLPNGGSIIAFIDQLSGIYWFDPDGIIM